MKTNYGSIDDRATISDALRQMKHLGTSILVVKKRHEHDEYGILLVSDIARQVMAKDRPPKRVHVYEIMRKPVVHVDPDMDVRYCSRLFGRFNLVRALVVENKTVIGTISPISLVLEGLAELED